MDILKKQNNKSKGSMMIELIVISAVMMVITLAASGVAKKSIEISRQSLHSMQASFLLEEGAEVLRVLRDTNFDNIDPAIIGTGDKYISFSGNAWSLGSTANTNGIFTRVINVATVYRDSVTGDIVTTGGVLDTGTTFVTVEVSWLESSQTITKTLSFYLTELF